MKSKVAIMKITFFSFHKFEKDTITKANQNKHQLNCLNTYLSPDTAILAQGSEAISVFVNDDCSEPVLQQLNALGVKGIACRSAGFNHVALESAKSLGIKVANVPEYSPYAVAEHTVALMLALNRRIIRANSRVRELNFSLDGLTGFDMHGKTVGIIGTGKIGAIVAKILYGFGCQILAYDPYPNKTLETTLNLKYTSLDELCKTSDIITLHSPLTKETHYLIDYNQIAKMKPGVMLINTSRGGLIQTKAVIDALKTRHIGYLGLDVYEEETGLFFEDHSDTILQDDVIARLLTFPNVLITSHQAFLTHTALQNIADTTFQTLNSWAAGEKSAYELF